MKTFDAQVDSQGTVTLYLHEEGKDDTTLTLQHLPVPAGETPDILKEPLVYVRTVDLEQWLNALRYVLHTKYGE